jgi:hypothetical protein
MSVCPPQILQGLYYNRTRPTGVGRLTLVLRQAVYVNLIFRHVRATCCTYCAVRSTLYVLPTQCVYVFCVDLRTNSDYFTVQH